MFWHLPPWQNYNGTKNSKQALFVSDSAVSELLFLLSPPRNSPLGLPYRTSAIFMTFWPSSLFLHNRSLPCAVCLSLTPLPPTSVDVIYGSSSLPPSVCWVLAAESLSPADLSPVIGGLMSVTRGSAEGVRARSKQHYACRSRGGKWCHFMLKIAKRSIRRDRTGEM